MTVRLAPSECQMDLGPTSIFKYCIACLNSLVMTVKNQDIS